MTGVMKIDYTVESKKNFDQLVEEIQAKISENGFKVLYVHDVQATMKGKGIEFPPFKIVELCNAKYAHAVLQADMTIGLMLPCKINVYEKDGRRYIAGMLPTAISGVFPDVSLGTVPQEVEKIVKKIIDELK